MYMYFILMESAINVGAGSACIDEVFRSLLIPLVITSIRAQCLNKLTNAPRDIKFGPIAGRFVTRNKSCV